METGGPKLHPLYVIKPWRASGQVVFPIYSVVLQAIDFDQRNGGELLIVRVHEPWVTFRVARPDKLFPLPDVRFEELLPVWPGRRTERLVP